MFYTVEPRRRFLSYCSELGLSSTLFRGVLWARLQAQPASKITRKMLKEAAAVAGLTFSDNDYDVIVDDVNANLGSYTALRKIHIDPAVAPPLYFNPIVPGVVIDKTKRPIRLSTPRGLQRPSGLDELAFWPVLHLAEILRTRQVTSVELSEMYLERLKRYDSKLKCVVTFTRDLAMKQARNADAEIAAGRYRGPLHGIPWGAKDTIALPGYPTTWGCELYKDQVLNATATVVARLEAAGAVLLAKLATGELAGGDKWFGGQTRNPWNPLEGSRGSSAGPAAATAAGLVGFAIGTETWGSIMAPSTRCGVTGLRPTFGRVSRTGVLTDGWSMDKVGALCRSVEDCAVVLDAIGGPDDLDLTCANIPFNWDSSTDCRKMRAGYLAAAFNEPRKVPESKGNDQAVLDVLRELGVDLVPIDLPQHSNIDPLQFFSPDLAAVHDELTRSGRDKMLLKDPNPVPKAPMYRTARFIPAVEYLQANRLRRLLMEEMARKMADIEVYVAPSGDDPVADQNVGFTNIIGYPAVSVPNGFTSKGTPTSITFVGRLFGEAQMLALAKAYQDATSWHLKYPKLD